MGYKKGSIILASLVLSVVALGGAALAAPTPTLNQTVNAGTLNTDITNSSQVPVASPAFAMSAAGFSFTCQSGGSSSTGTLGDNNNRIYVTNPSAVASFTLSIAATAGATATWTSGADHMDYNDAGTSGCSDTAASEADALSGQLTIDPSVATLTDDCNGACVSTGITQGASTAFVEGSQNNITLLNASATDKVWKGYLTGVGLKQTIPAQTKSGSYSLPLTLTVTGS